MTSAPRVRASSRWPWARRPPRWWRGDALAAPVFLAPFGLGVVLLILVPLIVTVGYAFTDATGLNEPSFNGLANLDRLRRDPFLPAAVEASLVHVALAVPLRLLVATSLGLLLAAPRPGGRLYRAAVYLPTVIPDLALSLVALWFFNPLHGPANRLLGLVGLPQPLWLSTPWGARWAVVLMLLLPIGEAFLVVLVSRRQVPARLYDAAALEGYGPFGQLRHVTLPLIAPILVLLAIRDTILTLQVNVVPAYLLTDGRPQQATLYLPLHVYDTAFEFSSVGYGSLLTLVVCAIAGVLVALQVALIRRWRIIR